MLEKAEDLIAEGDLEKIVDAAIDLNRRKTALENELEKLKVYLRAEAKKKGSFEVELVGLTGTITVTFPGLKLQLKKGTDLNDITVSLPPEDFSKLFVKTIEVKPALVAEDFVDTLATLKQASRSTVQHFIEAVEQTAKVYVPK